MAENGTTREGEGRSRGADGLLVRRHDRGLRQAATTATPIRSRSRRATAASSRVALTDTTNAQIVRNLGEPYVDATGQMRDMLVPGRFLFTYGVFYPQAGGHVYDAKTITFPGAHAHDYVFEKPDWWVKQIWQMADFYYRPSSATAKPNWREYRVGIDMTGNKVGDRQETDTISRLIYGLSTAYHMTGDDRFLKAAETGVEYLREHLRNVDTGEGLIYWYHAIEIDEPNEKKILASEFGDDYQAIPAYEQIYALVGPTQVYRITGDQRIKDDIDATIYAVRAVLLRPGVRRLLVAPRPDLVRRQERRAGSEPGTQELELGRRPRPGLSDQRLAGDRRRQVRGHARVDRRHDRGSASPTTPTARSSRSGSTRTGATT